MGPLVIAHRGASARAPENTLAAFELARELGADGVELDVRRTADGVLVVHHDAGVAGVGVIAEHTLAELRAAAPDLARLDEALERCAGLLVNVEIKNLPGDPDFDVDEAVTDAVVELLEGRPDDRVVVSAFHLPTVDRVRRRAPALPTAWLTLHTAPAPAAATAARHGHAGWHPWFGLVLQDLGPSVATAHERGLRIVPWTVDDEEHLALLARAGVDAIITNVPDVARRVVDAFE